jgi:general secretion pathway protein A
MYKDFYRLTEDPFNLTPDPRFLFLTDKHRDALDHLLYGIRQRKGFICLTGEVGAGKTTLCRRLLNELKDGYHTALILNPMLSQTQMLRAIAQEFGIVARCRDRLGYMQILNEFLLAASAQGKDVVLLIDEVQDMPDDTLELTRLLSNLETASRKLLQIVLVGQPELREKLSRPQFRQLAQRITVWYHLGTLTHDETDQYLRHRLKIAGAEDGLQFDASAVREIFEYSQGTPRLINAVGDKALLAGYVYQKASIDAGTVQLAIRELKEAC